ncbi:hypothetical protein GCM10027084_28810 [Pseudoxanthomonas sangjuensis]|jgi:hypothetical protein|uniref:hypothetical protein n=1 Tax=Pseudoxanthomonas sangjuensis TaxID=1503750 RepID=UPI0013909AAA|nr:hypothetical protein [Pseudoxanthomonas sangjuensis]
MRDIDAIIQELQASYPEISAERLNVLHPGADDDGVWFFRHSQSNLEIQLESSTGNAPFLVENSGSGDRFYASNVQQAVAMVVAGFVVPGSAA